LVTKVTINSVENMPKWKRMIDNMLALQQKTPCQSVVHIREVDFCFASPGSLTGTIFEARNCTPLVNLCDLEK
jgi:hypothetical protein